MNISDSLLQIGRWTNRSAAMIDREIDEELDFHVECRTQELISAGMSPEDAAREANSLFGSRDRIRHECQAISYGSNVWLLVILAAGLLICLSTIGWMSWKLKLSQQANRDMQALVASLQPAPSVANEKSDLTGEIKNAQGQPIAGARVLLIFKSWPGGQYQQEGMVQTSDDSGTFRFPDLYTMDMQKAFLITVLAEGHVMESEYVLYKPNQKVKPFRFKLQSALQKTLIVHDKQGKPVSNAVVFPSVRKPVRAKDEFLMYDQSATDAGFRTDANGKVRMSLFSAGDSVQLGVEGSDLIEFVVDAAPEQNVGIGMSGAAAESGGLQGTVTDTEGKPIAGAKVLLILKTWPNGRFQQQPSETHTADDGKFAFSVGNQADEKEAFLVTVLKDGFAFQSQYTTKKPGETAAAQNFALSPAMTKSFEFRDAAGMPLVNTTVAISGRTGKDSREHMVYGVSLPSVSFQTDRNGKVALNYFELGDTGTLSVESNGSTEEVRFSVDEKLEQAVVIKKKRK